MMPTLDSTARGGDSYPSTPNTHMGKQYNKTIKKKRREAYEKRKKIAAHAAAKKTPAKAKK